MCSELTKIRTLPGARTALGIACVANSVLAMLAATDLIRIVDRDGDVPIAQFGTLMLAPAYVFAAIAVFAAGSEYRGGQLRVSLIAVPNRNRLGAAKLIAATAASLLATIPAVLPGCLIRHAPAIADGRLSTGDAIADAAVSAAGYLLLSLIGYGFAIVAKSVVVPLTVLFAMPVLVSPLLQGVVPSLVKWLPHEATLAFLDLSSDGSGALPPTEALLVLIVWAGLTIASGWAAFIKRDN